MHFEDLYPDLGFETIGPGRRAVPVTQALLIPAIGSRSTPVYNAHSYHTKVPPEAIEPFIAHHTAPGAIVLDPFAGSGMTGVAARRLGRRALLNDLSPAAGHIAWNLTRSCDPVTLAAVARQVVADTTAKVGGVYATTCGNCGDPARIAYTIWSDRLACTRCERPVTVWDGGTDRATGRVSDRIRCSCGQDFPRRQGTRVDSGPVWVATDCGRCGRRERAVGPRDDELARRTRRSDIADPYPADPVGADREMFIRSALGRRAVATVADFYTPRNLMTLAALWARILSVADLRIRQTLALAFTNTAWHGTVMRRYNTRGGQRPLTGTLYIPELSSEVNVLNVFAHKVRHLVRFYEAEWESWPDRDAGGVQVQVGSATKLAVIPDRSVDYVFTDPPFGSNIFYADCNLIWEAWLGRLTEVEQEAVVNRSLRPAAGGKTLSTYRELMGSSFAEMARVLRCDAWLTLVFHSTNAEVWRSIEDAARQAGLSMMGATHLDKTQLSHKGYKGRRGAEDVAAFDVVLALRNRRPSSRRVGEARDERHERAVAILAKHLAELPAPGAEPAADRQRTLPYMHSLLVQHHFNGDIGLHVGDFDLVRSLCAAHFVQDEVGRWTVPAPGVATVLGG